MKKHNASILVVTLLILGVVLMIALTVSLVSIKQRQASLGAGKSNLAFQNADTGVEEVMSKVVNNGGTTLGNLDATNWICSILTGGNHAVLKSVTKGYSVELKKADETQSTDCSTSASEIASIKSTGIGSNQESRAIEAAVAAGGGGITGGCTIVYGAASPPDYTGQPPTNLWGSGCSASGNSSCELSSATGYKCGPTGAYYGGGGLSTFCECIKS
jgi:hypothetical protein